ncbi:MULTISPECIES: glucosaminidase domain-containing protein [unclassified Variovorax]|uniref:glucosaminidase domain-containing protein n=1 Tax=unclassified Variovorax TaxID=663243 RepID=UPI003F48A88A
MAELVSVGFDPFKKSTTPDDFSARYGAAAEKAAKALGVDPKVVLGQWGLETGWGKSVIPGTNNLGNIKDFGGGGVGATDNMTGSRDKYRAYETPDHFVDDYVSLIQRKYPSAVNAKTPEDFAKALKSGGYAEDPGYVAKVTTAAKMTPAKAAAGPTLAPVDFDPFASAAGPTPPAQEAPQPSGAAFVYPKAKRDAKNNTPNALDAIAMGVARGVKDPIDTGAELLASGYDKLTGNGPNVSGLVTGQQGEGARVRAMNQQGKQDFADEYGGSSLASAGRVGGNILATLPVGPALGAGAKVMGMERLGNALASGGMTAAQKVAPGLVNGAADLGIRSLGGAITGGITAGAIDPNSAGLGAAVGGALPIVGKAATVAGNALGSAVRPFYAAGQQRIAGDVLRNTATNPTNALSQLRGSAPVVPGSMPTTAMAAGDEGLAALSRTMQNSTPEYASALAARQTAQNQARSSAIEGIAGNTGKLDLAKQARNALTGPMREEALNAAGKVPSQGIIQQIDGLIADPNNAGQLSQQALNQFKSRIENFTQDGAIDARALYAIRKDINDVLGGKLQGEAGNLKYAASQLSGVKGFIDDAIDQASKAMPANAIGPTTRGAPNWKGYLQKYADESVPINQMEKLEDILKSIQTGSVDSQGGAIISGAKLNNVLKNKGADLAKDLSPAQLQVLRNIQADLNAGQIANNVGRAVGSNTVQNLAQNQLLQGALGGTLGGSTAATSTLGRVLQLPYGTANKQIQERLSNALLDPQEAARLLSGPQTSALRNALSQGARTIGYRAAPALSVR